MPRYRMVTSTDTAGGFAEFTADDDDAARNRAQDYVRRYGGRVVALSEETPFDHTRRVSLDSSTDES